MRKFLQIIILLSCFALPTEAQDVNLSPMFAHDMFLLNPSRTGEFKSLHTIIGSRKQWAGLQGAPESIFLGLHGKIADNAGLGGNILKTDKGIISTITGNIDYSFTINFTGKHYLSFGALGGFFIRDIDRAGMNATDISDETLYNSEYRTAYFHAGSGLFYKWKNLNADLAFPALLQDGNKFNSHFITGISYDFNFQNKLYIIKPGALYHFNPISENQIEAYVIAKYKNTFWLQTGYCNNKTTIIGGGVTFNNIGIGYLFEASAGNLSHISKGSHNIILTYRFVKKTASSKQLENQEKDIKDLKKELKGKDETLDRVKQEKEKLQDTIDDKEEKNKTLSIEKQVLENKLLLIKILNNLGNDKAVPQYSEKGSIKNLSELDANGEYTKPAPGYYVIVKSFKSQKKALNAINTLEKGEVKVGAILNKTYGWYYIYTSHQNNVDSALKGMEEFRKLGYSDAWVFEVK